jgi:hypothetical protein
MRTWRVSWRIFCGTLSPPFDLITKRSTKSYGDRNVQVTQAILFLPTVTEGRLRHNLAEAVARAVLPCCLGCQSIPQLRMCGTESHRGRT